MNVHKLPNNPGHVLDTKNNSANYVFPIYHRGILYEILLDGAIINPSTMIVTESFNIKYWELAAKTRGIDVSVVQNPTELAELSHITSVIVVVARKYMSKFYADHIADKFGGFSKVVYDVVKTTMTYIPCLEIWVHDLCEGSVCSINFDKKIPLMDIIHCAGNNLVIKPDPPQAQILRVKINPGIMPDINSLEAIRYIMIKSASITYNTDVLQLVDTTLLRECIADGKCPITCEEYGDVLLCIKCGAMVNIICYKYIQSSGRCSYCSDKITPDDLYYLPRTEFSQILQNYKIELYSAAYTSIVDVLRNISRPCAIVTQKTITPVLVAAGISVVSTISRKSLESFYNGTSILVIKDKHIYTDLPVNVILLGGKGMIHGKKIKLYKLC